MAEKTYSLKGIVKTKSDKTGGILVNDELNKEEVWVNGAPKEVFDEMERGDSVEFTLKDGDNGGYKFEALKAHEHNQDEAENLQSLLDWAHTHGLTGITTEMLFEVSNLEKGIAVFRATASFIDKEGRERNYVAHGDTIVEGQNTNVQGKMKQHYIRFAESRAIARCLRFARGPEEAKKNGKK